MPTSAAARLAALPFVGAEIETVREIEAQPKEDHRYLHEPARWITERIGDYLWSKQREIVQAVHDHRRTAVPSAHEMGKSWTAARVATWWIDVHDPGDAFVVSTAPTARQVRAILWREINRAHRAGQLPGRMNQTEWFIGNELVAFGQKPDDYDPTAFQGIHARRVLVILDEACGIPRELYLAAQSLAANEGSRVLAIGNPDDPDSYFAEICAPGTSWHVITVDGYESPNFTDERADVPERILEMLMGPTYVQEMIEDVGEDSAVFKSKVRGQFSFDKADGVIPLSAIRKCQGDFDWTNEERLPVVIGFDVGAGGDDPSTLWERRGHVAGRKCIPTKTDESEILAREACDFINECGADEINVDVIGVGWGIVGRLRAMGEDGHHMARVYGVNVGTTEGVDKLRFPRLRDQIWWECGREAIMRGTYDLTALDDKTVAQLISPTYKEAANGIIQVESKELTRKKLRRSPDDADAWLLACYQAPREKKVRATIL